LKTVILIQALISLADKNSLSRPFRLGIPVLDHVAGARFVRAKTFASLMKIVAPGAELVYGDEARKHACDAYLGWGMKPSTRLALQLSRQYDKPLWRCEDSFVRSSRPVIDPPLGLIVDDSGIYYDHKARTRLEKLICCDLSPSELDRARKLIELWRNSLISKYNYKPESTVPDGPYVLVIDQTYRDLSVTYGGAGQQTFDRMIKTALQLYPELKILVKSHPVSAEGLQIIRNHGAWRPEVVYKPGYCQLSDRRNKRIDWEISGGHPTSLIKHSEAVFVVTSQVGFEALIWGKPVHCFGSPFYSGWGLTIDYGPVSDFRSSMSPISLEALVHAALIDYACYIDHSNFEQCKVEDLLLQLSVRRIQNHCP
jgi:capsular polysaccharide export protein